MLRVLAFVAFLLLLPATASGSFDGSTGKVAYIDTDDGLYIDDPFDDQPAQDPLATVSDQRFLATAGASPPAWSPDGTLLAYTAPIDDNLGVKHSAVFVMKADGTEAWTPNGDIAYIRMVFSGDQSTHVSERGTSVRVVDPSGAEDARRYYLEPRANGPILSFDWPTASIHRSRSSAARRSLGLAARPAGVA